MDKMIDPFCAVIADHLSDLFRYVLFLQDASPDRIIHIMMNIGDLIGKPHNPAFQRGRISLRLMVQDTVPYFHCQV